MINRVVMVGRMTRDPEFRRTGNGATVTSFTLALNRNFKTTDEQQADYISCVVWNKVAENVERYCSKGSLVGVEGRLRSRSYDNAQGQKVYVTEVVCDSVQFLDSKNSTNKEYSQQSVTANNQFQQPVVSSRQDDFMNINDSFKLQEDDIQF